MHPFNLQPEIIGPYSNLLLCTFNLKLIFCWDHINVATQALPITAFENLLIMHIFLVCPSQYIRQVTSVSVPWMTQRPPCDHPGQDNTRSVSYSNTVLDRLAITNSPGVAGAVLH